MKKIFLTSLFALSMTFAVVFSFATIGTNNLYAQTGGQGNTGGQTGTGGQGNTGAGTGTGTGNNTGTCSDGIKNGDETDIDKGGRCDSSNKGNSGPSGLQITLTNPLKSNDLTSFVQTVVGVILKFVIPILAILFIYTGFQLATSGGRRKG